MKSILLNARWKWLRLVLAVLLPLHAGFAQAAMVMPANSASTMEAPQQPGASASESTLMPDGMPCHHQAKSSPAPDHLPQHQGDCCDAGSCHCVAVCGLSLTIARIAPQPGFTVPPFFHISVPATARPPDLRPPIV